MLTVGQELTCASTDIAIKSAIFHLTEQEYANIKEIAEEMNEQQGLMTLECYTID
jgi:hypothetical protein